MVPDMMAVDTGTENWRHKAFRGPRILFPSHASFSPIFDGTFFVLVIPFRLSGVGTDRLSAENRARAN